MTGSVWAEGRIARLAALWLPAQMLTAQMLIAQMLTALWMAALMLVALLLVAGPARAGAATPSKRQMAAIEAQLRQHVTTLASDEYGGREPGTNGETLTLRYLARQWFDIGLE